MPLPDDDTFAHEAEDAGPASLTDVAREARDNAGDDFGGEVPDQTPQPAASPDASTAPLQRVDPRYRTVETIGWWIITAVLSIGSLIGAIIVIAVNQFQMVPLLASGLGWGLFTGFLCFLSIVWPKWEYIRTMYRLSDEGIEIRKGVLWRRVINVPKSRIQHTDVTQGPIMRNFGIATLTIHTAGTHNASVALNGLNHKRALELRDFLIETGMDDGV